MRYVHSRVIVVGAGLAGITAARILRDHGCGVQVFERTDFIGGACYDQRVRGCLTQLFGAHIFHTNKRTVWDFVNLFSKFKRYKHRVVANTSRGLLPIPYGDAAEKITGKITDEEIIDLIFREYSKKQWSCDYDVLPGTIKGRVKKRAGKRLNYFVDEYQGVPKDGYTKMLENMLDGCKVQTGCSEYDYRDLKCSAIVYTGRLDQLLHYVGGELDYRTLKFSHELREPLDYPVINDCTSRVKWTRMYDSSHFYGLKRKDKMSVVTTETPAGRGEPAYYPYPDQKNLLLAEWYKDKIKMSKNIFLCGRLAKYKYMNMDETIYDTIKEVYGGVLPHIRAL